jgi:epoxyqueuosine reductase
MEDRIFGCDICMEVCPHNRKAHPSRHPELAPSQGAGERLGWEEIGSIRSNGEYEKRFEGTPLKRLGLKRLKRNLEAVAFLSRTSSKGST